MEYNNEQKILMLRYARAVVRDRLYGESNADKIRDKMKDEIFLQKRGAFTTIHKEGQLRGCIGYIEPIMPLVDTIRDTALHAAFRDPRFSPLTKGEYDYIDFEISILTIPKKIKDISEIVVGKHGIIISRGYNRGLLLPQVATEYGWDREEFLRNTCYKAGMSGNCYKDKDTVIEIFSAEVFSERELGLI